MSMPPVGFAPPNQPPIPMNPYPQPAPGGGYYPPLNQHVNYGPDYNYQPPPTMNQPMAQNFMYSSASGALGYLTQVDQLLVHQKVELLEAFVGFETANKYTVKNSMGQKVFYAVEENDCCTRNCCGPIRPFEMKIFDNSQQEVIHISRPLRCDSCCFPCCLQEIEVMSPPGNVIGYVKQEWSICIPRFAIKNASGDTVLRIVGPLCTLSCRICGDVEFSIMTRDESTEIGRIVKQWSGLVREMFTDADHFGVSFPLDLDVNIKAVLLAALFLIDFMYFETKDN